MELLCKALTSPYLTLGLSFLVLYHWAVKTIYNFEWRFLGGIVARLLFCVVYATVIFSDPAPQELRYVVRVGLNLLFVDELINWGAGSKFLLKRKLDKKAEEIKKLHARVISRR